MNKYESNKLINKLDSSTDKFANDQQHMDKSSGLEIREQAVETAEQSREERDRELEIRERNVEIAERDAKIAMQKAEKVNKIIAWASAILVVLTLIFIAYMPD